MKFVSKVICHPMSDGISPYISSYVENVCFVRKLAEMGFMSVKWHVTLHGVALHFLWKSA